MIVFIEKFATLKIPLIIFLIFFVFDLILGISKGFKYKNFSSGKLKDSVPKFLAYSLTILSTICIDVLADFATDIKIFNNYSPMSTGFTVFICLIEFASIFENGYLLGAKYPKFIVSFLKLINKDIDEKVR